MTLNTRKSSVSGRRSPALTFFSLLLFLGLAWPGLALSAPDGSPLARHSLTPGVTALVMPDGGLVFVAEGQSSPLLTGELSSLADGRRLRSRGLEIFNDRLSEGALGGLRGFSSGADDDQDGVQDEDPRDGLDNDGDGLVDEDFAAIGDVMTVVRKSLGTVTLRQESYHWTSPEMRNAVFLSLVSSRKDMEFWSVNTGQACWIETDITAPIHTATGRIRHQENHPFVTHIQGGNAATDVWLGVMVLGDRPGYLALGGDEGCRLDFPLDETPLPLVVCTAPTWLELVQSLTLADLVYRGVADPLNDQAASWILPAACGKCRIAELPEFSYRVDEGRTQPQLIISMNLSSGQFPLVDPDNFTLEGRRLGSPDELVWRPTSGDELEIPWGQVDLVNLRQGSGAPGNPLEQLGLFDGHDKSGVLEFRFGAEGLSEGLTGDKLSAQLSGSSLDGRRFQIRANRQANDGDPALDLGPAQPGKPFLVSNAQGSAQALEVLNSEQKPPTLSAQLLEGWPNPFRDAIQIRFKIPQTVGEAFAWADADDEPRNLDKGASVPWTGGIPAASVKIYSINGQELLTLYDGSADQGDYTVQWNGADAFGRQVASGTYFCKLQLDQWSVTRRLVYIR